MRIPPKHEASFGFCFFVIFFGLGALDVAAVQYVERLVVQVGDSRRQYLYFCTSTASSKLDAAAVQYVERLVVQVDEPMCQCLYFCTLSK